MPSGPLAFSSAYLELCWLIWALSWLLFGPSWGLLGPSWGHLGVLLGFLWPSWAPLGRPWGVLGAAMRPTWLILGSSGAPRGHLGSSGRTSWTNLVRFGGHFEAFWTPVWVFLGPCWAMLGPSSNNELMWGDHRGITLRFLRLSYLEISSKCFRRFLEAPFLIIAFRAPSRNVEPSSPTGPS